MRQQQLALTAAGHNVVMVSAARGRGARVRSVVDGIEIAPLFFLPGVQLPLIPNNTSTRSTLNAFFEKHGVDAVHVQTEFGLAHAAADVAAARSIPVIHTVHTFYWASEDNWFNPLAGFARWALTKLTGAKIPRQSFTPRAVDNLLRNLTLAMAERADTVVSPSAHQARDLEAAGVAGPVALVPNPVSTSPRPPTPLPTLAGSPRFLWVARCEPVKRPLPFARAAIEALRRTDDGFSIDFVGDGTDRAELQRIVAGHPQLRIQGALPHDDVLDLMDAASIIVLTSVGFDNQPMTIAEAVSRHRGILYCDPKLREGLLRAGHLAAGHDEADLTDAIVELVQNPSLLTRLSEGAAADGAQFSPGVFVGRMIRVFDDAVEKIAVR